MHLNNLIQFPHISKNVKCLFTENYSHVPAFSRLQNGHHCYVSSSKVTLKTNENKYISNDKAFLCHYQVHFKLRFMLQINTVISIFVNEKYHENS